MKELGIADALRFVMATEPGDGDSVQEYQKMWEGKSVDEIYEAICRDKNNDDLVRSGFPEKLTRG